MPESHGEFHFDPSKLPSEQLDETEFIYDKQKLADFVCRYRGICVPADQLPQYPSTNKGSDSTSAIVSEIVRQLRPGMDLTRVSLPAVCTKPISTLESVAENASPSYPLLFRYLGTDTPAADSNLMQCMDRMAVAAAEGDVKHSRSMLTGLLQPLLVDEMQQPAAKFALAEQRMLAILQWHLVLLANTPQKGFKHVKPFLAFKNE
jgi:Oxysterol-binding protein